MGKPLRKAPDQLASRLQSLKTAADGDLKAFLYEKVERQAVRHRTYKFGIVEADKANRYPCIIQDLSTTGAKIALEGAFRLPPRIILKINQTGASQECRVAWQDENIAGLEF
ncbi:MAG: PilZ domain-containing protein [Pseudomonadota bacterium]